VGITRARERLYLTNAWCRQLHGSTQYNPPSRFLDEIPAELVTEVATRSGRVGGGSRRFAGSSGPGQDRRRAEQPRRPTVSSFDPDEDVSYGHRDRFATGHIGPGGTGPSATPPPTLDAGDLSVGDRVHHLVFGDGRVVGLEGEGSRAEVVVRFDGAGERRLLLSFAPLERR
jgi:DNA helicase-2/ATP-dependent DNA helicase PcrA